MKSILSAAALLVAIASPALAEEATGTQPQPAPAVVEIVPAATEPSVSEAQPAAVEGETQSKAAMGGHGCGSKKTVYLTN
jgi:opacity protein-like surface antigen